MLAKLLVTGTTSSGRSRDQHEPLPRVLLDPDRNLALEFGHDLDRVLTTTDLVSGDNVFFAATGVTDGALLRGVRFAPEWVTTQSLSMRSRSGAVRVIETRHDRTRSNLIGPWASQPAGIR